MPEATSLVLFVTAALALLLTPGPAVLFVVNRSVQRGRANGFAATLGLSVGGLVHVIGTVLGLSAILMASATAFSLIKYAGAAYLIYLGVKTIFVRGKEDPGETAATSSSSRRAFVDGVVVNVLNPKAALFFLAFLPQFADASRGPIAPQLLVLGLLFVSLGIVTDGLYVVVAGTLGRWLRTRPRAANRGRWVVGSTYIGLGILAATSNRRV